MAIARPIFRIFDYNKAIEFYIDWLGFTIDWEDKPKDGPIYMQVFPARSSAAPHRTSRGLHARRKGAY
jgi:catechol 2,3-dioxygenase-like lactoylglutathione lyase family enzyme